VALRVPHVRFSAIRSTRREASGRPRADLAGSAMVRERPAGGR
jgi:hypothetical protein